MKLYILMLTIILIISCNEGDIVPPTRVDSLYDTLDLSNYYPLQIGNVWRYEENGSVSLRRTIVDTIRDDQNNLTFKASFGIGVNDSYEYYYWDEFGLNVYLCGVEDTCRDESGNDIQDIWYLTVKTPILEGDSWHAPPSNINTSEISTIEILPIVNHTLGIGTAARDTILYDVAQVTSSWAYYTNPTLISIKHYAKNIGLIKYVSLSDDDTLAVLTLSEYYLN